ncbi:hypothetical protein G9U51_14220 [Calidifontibacter sp. DB0510]|uniref:Uncharacterized protein n=1 Tax=Metallococcus carri TaxID=1656884 RepID=A0A967EBG6_9MICO|nr:hypothetical protein [Metallococcus carri]NHN56929.1 hypothetical protein [Metallococcus carri]NOP37674.1 hypothetical protein [Calidifontibacter sp. DB2511S]
MTGILMSSRSVRSLIIELAATEDELRTLRFAEQTPACRSRRRELIREQGALVAALRQQHVR